MISYSQFRWSRCESRRCCSTDCYVTEYKQKFILSNVAVSRTTAASLTRHKAKTRVQNSKLNHLQSNFYYISARRSKHHVVRFIVTSTHSYRFSPKVCILNVNLPQFFCYTYYSTYTRRLKYTEPMDDPVEWTNCVYVY